MIHPPVGGPGAMLSSMDQVEGLTAALRVQVGMVAQIADTDLARPTTCPEWDVEAVLRHSLGVTCKFTDFASGRTDRPRAPVGDVLRPDRESAFEKAASDAVGAWRVADLTRICHLPFGAFSAAEAAGINLFDVLAHTWDVAQAIGLAMPCPDELWDVGHAAARAVLEMSRDPRQYGPARRVPESATPRQRFLADLGRGDQGDG